MCFWPEGLLVAEIVLRQLEKSNKNDDNSLFANKVSNLSEIVKVLQPVGDLELLFLYNSEKWYGLSGHIYLPKDREAAGKEITEIARRVSEGYNITSYDIHFFVTEGGYYSKIIGRGFFLGCKHHKDFLDIFLNTLSTIPQNTIDISVLLGFLEELRKVNPNLCNETLEKLHH